MKKQNGKAKVVFLYTRINDAVKLGVDPSLLIPVNKTPDVSAPIDYWNRVGALFSAHLKEEQ
jgi:hypothetical protein